jgi:hypothetical protein
MLLITNQTPCTPTSKCKLQSIQLQNSNGNIHLHDGNRESRTFNRSVKDHIQRYKSVQLLIRMQGSRKEDEHNIFKLSILGEASAYPSALPCSMIQKLMTQSPTSALASLVAKPTSFPHHPSNCVLLCTYLSNAKSTCA